METSNAPPKSKGDLDLIEAIDRHICEKIGEISFVLDEIDSPYAHIDLHVVAPTSERPYHVILTSGMAEKPMHVPEEVEDGTWAELMICLPPDWPISPEAFKDEANWWPFRLLKSTARFPYVENTWLYAGHTISDGGDPVPYAANTKMSDLVLLRPRLIPGASRPVRVSVERQVTFWGLFPIHRDELEFCREFGSDRLEQIFIERGITELLLPGRPSVLVQ